MSGRRRVFLGLGSNLGDRSQRLAEAVAGLPDVVAVSPVYQTDPVGGPPGQGPYLNMVVELATELTGAELLSLAGALEDAAGRVRAERFGPRSLDVDVLWVDGEQIRQPRLVVPHPRLPLRGFVLVPLADLDSELVVSLAGPGWRQRLGAGVRPYVEMGAGH